MLSLKARQKWKRGRPASDARAARTCEPQAIAEAQTLAAIARQVRQSLWRSRSSVKLDHYGATSNRTERKDDLEKHR